MWVWLMGAVFGVAATGALFKALENNKLVGLLTRAGADFDASDRTEVRGLLSGSEAAETTLAKLAPEAAAQVEHVGREVFVFALDGAAVVHGGVLGGRSGVLSGGRDGSSTCAHRQTSCEVTSRVYREAPGAVRHIDHSPS